MGSYICCTCLASGDRICRKLSWCLPGPSYPAQNLRFSPESQQKHPEKRLNRWADFFWTFPGNFQEFLWFYRKFPSIFFTKFLRNYPGNFREISGKISGRFPGICPEKFMEFSWKFQRNFTEFSRKLPENSGKFPGHFYEIFRKISEHIQEISGEISRKFHGFFQAEKFQEVSGKFPEKFPGNFREIPGCFPEISRRCNS